LARASNGVGNISLSANNKAPNHTPQNPVGYNPFNLTTNSRLSPVGHSPLNLTTNSPLSPVGHSPLNLTTNSPLSPVGHSPLNLTTNSPLNPVGHNPFNLATQGSINSGFSALLPFGKTIADGAMDTLPAPDTPQSSGGRRSNSRASPASGHSPAAPRNRGGGSEASGQGKVKNPGLNNNIVKFRGYSGEELVFPRVQRYPGGLGYLPHPLSWLPLFFSSFSFSSLFRGLGYFFKGRFPLDLDFLS
jgi:hypothetical protein